MQVDSSGNLYVLATGSGGVPGVAVYAPGAGKLLRKMPGVGCGAAIALDHSDNVYALDRCGFVYVFKAGGTSLLRKITAGLERPAAIAIDRDGTLYAANQQNNTITVYPAGTTTPSRTITAGVVAPRALALDRSSNLYVVNEGNVTVYASGSSSVLRTIARGLPLAIVIDSEGFVYVALHAPDRILVFRNNSDRAAYSIRQSLHTPYALALDSAGNLYVDNMFGKSVTVYAKLSNKLLSTISGAFELPYAFAVGPSQ
jgi:sugar lactone lactonase YvrE